MKKIWILVIVLIRATAIPISEASWTEYRITTSSANQGSPKINENTVVWGDSGGSPIRGADISDPNIPLYFELPANPVDLGGSIVIYIRDSSLYGYNLMDSSEFLIGSEKSWPATDGKTVVYRNSQGTTVHGYDLFWESEFEIVNSYCTGGPNVDGNSIVWNEPGVALFLFDLLEWQTFQISDTPANGFDISDNTVVGQIGQDLYGFDVSDPCNPVEFPICTDANEQREPAISGNIIVWKDNRNGNWDIYGYDISTQAEFQITDNTSDQHRPAISGHTVVWEDWRHGQYEIYATILYGPQVPKCLSPIQGDINGDCKVNFVDFVLMVDNWLECNLDPPEACWQ